jgi:Zn-dependent protease
LDVPGIVRQIAISALPILIAITFHEVAHGFVAYKLGDKTAWALGRLSLNPVKHIDPVGTVLLPLMLLIFTRGGVVFGYAKPVPINSDNFENPKRDMGITGVAGPVTNIALAMMSVLVLKYVIPLLAQVSPDTVTETVLKPLGSMFNYSIMINVFLACFNLLPIPPLDGGRVAVSLLPKNASIALSNVEPYGFIILIVLIFTGMYRIFVIPLYSLIMAFLRLL